MIDVAAETLEIMAREGGWSDAPPDPPTNRGVSLPQWNKYCIATGRTFRSGKANLRAISQEDALAFYDWYFRTQGLNELVAEFRVPAHLVPHVMDLRTQHSPEGVRWILMRVRAMLPDGWRSVSQEVAGVLLAAARARYLLGVANEPEGYHLKRDFFGLTGRCFKPIGWWPPQAGETKEA